MDLNEKLLLLTLCSFSIKKSSSKFCFNKLGALIKDAILGFAKITLVSSTKIELGV